MKGRTVLVVLIGALLLVLGFVFYIGATGGGTSNLPPAPRTDAAPAPTTDQAPADKHAGGDAGAVGAIAKTIRDRKVRDELRQRILAGWAAEGTGEQATAARAGRFVPRPNADGTGIDPKYIQEVVRSDLFPMAKQCYGELLARKPDAGGRLEMSFTIAADADLGGIVEDAEVTGLDDEKMSTCMRESLSTLAFPPPAHDGVVTVKYPIVLSPDGDRDE